MGFACVLRGRGFQVCRGLRDQPCSQQGLLSRCPPSAATLLALSAAVGFACVLRGGGFQMGLRFAREDCSQVGQSSRRRFPAGAVLLAVQCPGGGARRPRRSRCCRLLGLCLCFLRQGGFPLRQELRFRGPGSRFYQLPLGQRSTRPAAGVLATCVLCGASSRVFGCASSSRVGRCL